MMHLRFGLELTSGVPHTATLTLNLTLAKPSLTRTLNLTLNLAFWP